MNIKHKDESMASDVERPPWTAYQLRFRLWQQWLLLFPISLIFGTLNMSLLLFAVAMISLPVCFFSATAWLIVVGFAVHTLWPMGVMMMGSRYAPYAQHRASAVVLVLAFCLFYGLSVYHGWVFGLQILPAHRTWHLLMVILGAAWGIGVAVVLVSVRDADLQKFDEEMEASFREQLFEDVSVEAKDGHSPEEMIELPPDKSVFGGDIFDDADTYFLRGTAYEESERYEDAIASYKKAVAIEPEFARAYCSMGNAYVEIEQHANAIAAYEKAVAIESDFADAYYFMGNAYADLGQYVIAIQAYKKAIALKPNAVTYFFMGNAYEKMDRYTDAIAAQKKAVSVKPDYAAAYLFMGNAYEKMDRHTDAIAAYRQCLRIVPTGPGAELARLKLRELEEN